MDALSRPRRGSAGTAPCIRRRRRRHWSGCSTPSPRAARSRGCTAARPVRRSACCAGPGARGLAVDLVGALGRRPRPGRPRRSRRGRRVALGVVPSTDPADVPTDSQVTEAVVRWLDMVGLDPEVVGDRLVLTPACGLAGATPDLGAAVAFAAAGGGQPPVRVRVRQHGAGLPDRHGGPERKDRGDHRRRLRRGRRAHDPTGRAARRRRDGADLLRRRRAGADRRW